jgi:uncharacterized membrane protein
MSRVWMIPLVAAVLGFLSEKLYSFWGVWDTSAAPIPPHPGLNSYFWFLGTHMTSAFIAMFATVILLWPGLRKRYPRLHRVTGRVYVVATLVGGACGLTIIRFAGASGRVGIFLATIMWMGATVIALICAGRGKYEMHRRFMLYSFATLMSVTWGVPIVRIGLVLPVAITANYVTFLVEASRWAGWLLNILVVQWWLLRTAPYYAAHPLTGRKTRVGKEGVPPALAVPQSGV